MKRVERYRKVRHFRKKVILAFSAVLILLVTGICISDYSINNLMNNARGLKIVDVANLSNAGFEISFMDKKLYINTQYIKKDLDRFKNSIGHILNK